MNEESVTSRTYPFRVFISHKIDGHARAAKEIKATLENLAIDKLAIFVSPAFSPV